jgi:hypothetical protein
MVRTPSQAHFSATKTRSTVALIRARVLRRMWPALACRAVCALELRD